MFLPGGYKWSHQLVMWNLGEWYGVSSMTRMAGERNTFLQKAKWYRRLISGAKETKN